MENLHVSSLGLSGNCMSRSLLAPINTLPPFPLVSWDLSISSFTHVKCIPVAMDISQWSLEGGEDTKILGRWGRAKIFFWKEWTFECDHDRVTSKQLVTSSSESRSLRGLYKSNICSIKAQRFVGKIITMWILGIFLFSISSKWNSAHSRSPQKSRIYFNFSFRVVYWREYSRRRAQCTCTRRWLECQCCNLVSLQLLFF